ncbi:MAG: DoxX family membrane protein [Acidimicrobiales bacterium]|nr:DoxX family membrane protein [Acidimicrobiales bacterium]HCK75135.1 hypothetical protein [Acidimicrobiaceae bacterium]
MVSLARIVLGVVFLTSGALKIRDSSWAATAAAFGTPRLLAKPLPFLEIFLGSLLVAGLGVPWTSIAAEVLLAVFTVAMLRAMRRPITERPRCACFGRWTARPVSSSSVVRNLVLLVIAAFSSGI